jgi:hypothetical protein
MKCRESNGKIADIDGSNKGKQSRLSPKESNLGESHAFF